MTEDLGLGEMFKCTPLDIDNTSALHVLENHPLSPITKPVALKLVCICEISQEDRVSIRYVPTKGDISDLGMKFLSKNRHQYLIGVTKEFRA